MCCLPCADQSVPPLLPSPLQLRNAGYVQTKPLPATTKKHAKRFGYRLAPQHQQQQQAQQQQAQQRQRPAA